MKKTYQGIMLLCISAMFFLLPYLHQKWVDTYSVSGQMLVMSSLAEEENLFAKSVVFITRHDLLGAFGVMMNRVDHEIEVEGQTVSVLYGGPVGYDDDIYYVIHSGDVMEKDSHKIMDMSLFLLKVKGKDALTSFLKKPLGARQMIVAKGYTGWGIQQLDGEISNNTWHVLPYKAEWVFNKDRKELWNEIMKLIVVSSFEFL